MEHKTYVKSIDNYSFDLFLEYCRINGLDSSSFSYNVWKIQEHDLDLEDFLKSINDKEVRFIGGVVRICGLTYRVKTIYGLSIKEAFNKVLTPDITDFEIFSITEGCYHVKTKHCVGTNDFMIYVK